MIKDQLKTLIIDFISNEERCAIYTASNNKHIVSGEIDIDKLVNKVHKFVSCDTKYREAFYSVYAQLNEQPYPFICGLSDEKTGDGYPYMISVCLLPGLDNVATYIKKEPAK